MPIVAAGVAAAAVMAWFMKYQIASMTLFAIVGGLATFLNWVIGMIQGVLTAILFQIMPYNNFINEDVVVRGWVMIRDLSNMFFILILLIIAFATILRIESYSWKKNLPKLLIMAVLINFSKTICGLAIDFGQVIMLTFANAFAAAGPANLYDAFGMKNLFTLSKAGDALITGGTITDQVKNNVGFAVTGSLVLGLIMLMVATIVIATFVIILIFRIIMLWVLIILSPLAFLAMAIPAGTKYASQWMGEFTKYVVTGPVLAFFLWLALTMNANTSPLNITATDAIKQSGIESLGAGSEASKPNNMKNFIVTTLFLIAGLSMAQQIGGIGSAMGMNAVNNLKSKGATLAKKGAMLPLAGAKALATFGADKLQHSGIMDLNIVRAWTKLQESRKDKKSRMYAEGQDAAAARMARSGGVFSGLLAATATPGGAWEDISKNFSLRHPFSSKGIKQRLKGGKGMAAKREELLPGLEQAEFEANFSKLGKKEQGKKLQKYSLESGRLNEAIKSETDEEKKKELIKEKEIADNKTRFASDEYLSSRSQTEQSKLVKDKSEAAEAKRKDFEQYIPTYSFEAKSAEEKAIGAEAEKIKHIDDQQELVRMLKEAIQGHEKSRVKAIMRKLTVDYNDNEAFAALVPEAGTGYQGLQALMDGLSTKGDKNYAGFDKQEAYSLGAQVAEMNKKTNHWEAAAAYKMDNGQWRKNTAEEHAMIASTEFGKRAPRANARDFNRLAMGKHITDPKTGKFNYELTDVGLIALQSWDNAVNIDRMLEDMTESLAKFLLPFVDKLEEQGFFKGQSPKSLKDYGMDDDRLKQMKINKTTDAKATLADMIKIKSNQAREDFEPQFREVTGVREKLNS